MTAIEPITFRWRLRVMMAERGITTVTELRRQLQAMGMEISTQQLSRVVNELPQRVNTDLLAALITLLRCTPNDLFYIDFRATQEEPRPLQPAATVVSRPPRKTRYRKAGPKADGITEEDVLGPKVAPFPVPERKPVK